ncbi:MAG: YncE family protein, partial [Thermoplasmata archaeon]
MRLFSVLTVTILMCAGAASLLSVGESEALVAPDGMSLNGNQELVSDRDRPLVYSGDADGDKVRVLNATTRAEEWNVSVGYSPMSIDVSEDGRYLYVAVSTEMRIAIVDLQARSVSRTIDLTFEPLSIRIGLSDRLYVTSVPDENFHGGELNVVDDVSGKVTETLGGYDICVLDMSPDKSTLLMVQLNYYPIPIYLIACDSQKLTLLDSTGSELYGVARQVSVDWENDTLYLAGDASRGVEVVSISTLESRGVMNFDPSVTASVTGVALSPDRGILFCTTYGYSAELHAFNVSDGLEIASVTLCDYVLQLLVDRNTYGAVTAPPGVGSVVALGDPVQFLDLGTPGLSPQWPEANSTIESGSTADLSAYIYVGIPALEVTSHGMTLDGEPLVSHILGSALYGSPSAPVDEGGMHTVNASIAWDGGEATVSWVFYVTTPLQVLSMWPAGGEVIDHVPENITVGIDLGYPEYTLTDCQMSVNGVQPDWCFEGGVLAASTRDANGSNLLPGENWIVMELGFERVTDRNYTSSHVVPLLWMFSIIDATADPSYDGLSRRNLSSGVSLVLPTIWELTENITVGDTVFDAQAVGPANGSAAPVITVQCGVDQGIEEGSLSLESFADDLVNDMRAEGGDVYIVDG